MRKKQLQEPKRKAAKEEDIKARLHKKELKEIIEEEARIKLEPE